MLIAGTGAVAAVVRATEITRVADGRGWRLGAAGSGVWLGVQAVRATARLWYSGSTSDERGKLAAAVGIHDADALVTWGNAAAPVAAARLALTGGLSAKV